LDDALCDDGNCCAAPEVAGCVRRASIGAHLVLHSVRPNAAWLWTFFGANNPLLGVINIIPQILVILATVVGF
jgi:tryptophan-rich sensory protein